MSLIVFPRQFATVTNILSSWWDDNFNAINTAIDTANGIAGLGADARLNQAAKKIYDVYGTVDRQVNGNEVGQPNTIPVRDPAGLLTDQSGRSLYGMDLASNQTASGLTIAVAGTAVFNPFTIAGCSNSDFLLLEVQLQGTKGATAGPNLLTVAVAGGSPCTAQPITLSTQDQTGSYSAANGVFSLHHLALWVVTGGANANLNLTITAFSIGSATTASVSAYVNAVFLKRSI